MNYTPSDTNDITSINLNISTQIIGIGASAGGLEALQKLVGSLDPAWPLSFIVAQHLSPSHNSMLTELLSRSTRLSVRELNDNQIPQPGTIYIIPPNTDAILSEGAIRLFAPENAIGPKPSVDRLFLSLAKELGSRSVGVILSGTGRDGANGLREIKNVKGIAIVQDPISSKYNGMPNAALQDNRIDYIVSPEEIGAVLDAFVAGRLYEPVPMDDTAYQLHGVIQVIFEQTGMDLSGYKSSTLNRRLQRRLQVFKCSDIAAYVSVLKSDNEEAARFAREVLISVTEFFRDDLPFATLSNVLHELFANVEAGHEIRIWNPGCATGEETYSLAIIAEEIIRKLDKPIHYKIFATDIDLKALNIGRQGNYHKDSCKVFDDIWRERYFDAEGEFLTATKNIRNNIVFSEHNLAQDPPFSRIDLVSCRNLLIYFNNELQKRVLSIFNYALNQNGILFLGQSESIELHKDLFFPINREARIFRRQPNFAPTHLLKRGFQRHIAGDERNTLLVKPVAKSLEQNIQQFVAEKYSPPGLVINQMDDVLYVTGNTDPFITVRPGLSNNNIFNKLKDEFRSEARALIHKCRRDKTVCEGSTRRLADSSENSVTMVAQLLSLKKEPQPGEPVILSFVISRLEKQHGNSKKIAQDANTETQQRVEELENELASTEEHLQNVIEQLETSNEELQSLTEELQSTNEELQSSNEELQTSNEELQSTNEELLTVNEELEVKTREMECMTADLQNILNNADYPILVIDRNLRITRYVSAVKQLIDYDSIRHGDIITAVSWKVDIPDFRNILRNVMDNNTPFKSMLEFNNRHYQFFIRPHQDQGLNRQVIGAVLSFPEVTDIVSANKEIATKQNHLSALLDSVLLSIINIDTQGIICHANVTVEKMFGYDRNELIGQSIIKLMPKMHAEKHHQYMDEYLRTGDKKIIGLIRELEGKRKDGSLFPIELSITEFMNNGQQMFCGAINDVTKRNAIQSMLEKERLLARATLESISDAVITVDAQENIEYINPCAQKLTGYPGKAALGKKLNQVFRLYDSKGHYSLNEQLSEKLMRQESIAYTDIVQLKHLTDEEYSIEYSMAPLISKEDEYLGSVLSFVDVSNKQSLLQQMTWQAQHDPLTGLVNRKEFENRLENALVSAKTFNREHALLYLDLDQFKIVNDTCGHHAGDELLRQLAGVLATHIRSRDTLARMGGDEFAMLLENNSLDQAQSIAEKINEIVQDFRYSFESRIFKIGASIGVVSINNDTRNVQTVLSDADSACYAAKEAGRNRVEIHSPDNVDLQSRRRDMHWVSRINHAIDENRLVLYFQNIKSLKNHQKLHYEVLIRLVDENGELVPPGAFLPAAERYGLMTNLDQWVIKRLLLELNKFNVNSMPEISVNLSGISLSDPRFLANVSEMINANAGLANKICFEITETAAIINFRAAQEFIRSMKKFGCLFALDDFGSGMSSFGYLKNLPVDFLKIDGTFVKDVLVDEIDLFMVESINRIGQLMNMKTIAECAENEAIIEKLTEVGVDYAQGYGIGYPIPLDEFTLALNLNDKNKTKPESKIQTRKIH
jgi:two-component system, chemotaxis family, CheB/CheR fusion protein